MPAANCTESSILKECRQWLELHKWYVIRIHQSLGSMRGICDLIALKDGVTIYIEVKAPKGKLSPHQEAFARKIDEHGGLFIVARNSGTVERAVKNLRLELCGKDGKAAIAITDHKGMKVATAGQ